MDKQEAHEALELLRQVVSRARDDSALQNWGLIWMIHGVTNGAGFLFSGYMLESGTTEIIPYLGLWLGILGFNFVSIYLACPKRQSARTFVEKQIWSIWLTFLVAVFLVAGVNQLAGMPLFRLLPVVSILGAVSLAMMGALIGRVYYIGAVVFSVTALAMAYWSERQLFIFGIVWGVSQFLMGYVLHRRRMQIESGPTVV